MMKQHSTSYFYKERGSLKSVILFYVSRENYFICDIVTF